MSYFQSLFFKRVPDFIHFLFHECLNFIENTSLSEIEYETLKSTQVHIIKLHYLHKCTEYQFKNDLMFSERFLLHIFTA